MLADNKIEVLLTSTSFPRSSTDWQGIFIKKLVDSLGRSTGLDVKLWAPQGPVNQPDAIFTHTNNDLQFLAKMAQKGGIANIVKNHKLLAP